MFNQSRIKVNTSKPTYSLPIDKYYPDNRNSDQITVIIEKGAYIYKFSEKEIKHILDNFSNIVSERVIDLFHKTTLSLLKNRDFLGHQLNYHIGNISDEQFKNILDKYLIPNFSYDIDTLAEDIRLLMKITALVFDADEISIMFNCDINDAEKALTKIITNSR